MSRLQPSWPILSILPLMLLFSTPLHAQWEPDVRLTYNDSTSELSFNNAWCVATGPGGVVHVVWQDKRDQYYGIYYRRSTDSGLSWSPEIQLSNSTRIAFRPSCTVSNSDVHVVWQDTRDSSGSQIYYKRSSDMGVTWTADTRLSHTIGQAEHAGFPSASAYGQNVFVVWNTSDYQLEFLYFKRSTDSGVTWFPDTCLLDRPYVLRPVSISALGTNVHLVWDDVRSGNAEMYYKRSSDLGATWSQDTCISGAVAVFPSIGGSGTDVHVVWGDWVQYEIYYKHSTDSGITWSPLTTFTNDTCHSWFPSIAVSGRNVHVVWYDSRDGNPEIYYKHSTDDGMTWSADTRLTFNSAYSGDPSIAVSGSIVHVIWVDQRDGNNEIYYKRNPTGNIGVEEEEGGEGPRVQGFKITPNPFASFASVPGHEGERFDLYDIAGRKVGTYKGDRIGEGLPAGVYFLRAQGSSSAPLRIVKVR